MAIFLILTYALTILLPIQYEARNSLPKMAVVEHAG